MSVVLSAAETFVGADFGYQQRLPVLGVAKEVTGAAVQSVDGTFTVSLQITLENLGSSPLLNLRLTDDLQAAFPFPAAVVSVSSPVAISPASPTVTTNSFYDGTTDIDLLLPTQSSLGIGETAVIGFDVTFSAPDPTATFFNSAIGAATSPSGQSTIDVSVGGADPDPDGDGDPGSPGEGAPTPIFLPAVMAIPTLGHPGMLALALILLFVGLWSLRRVS